MNIIPHCVGLLVVTWLIMAVTLYQLIVTNVRDTNRVIAEPDVIPGAVVPETPTYRFVLPIPTVYAPPATESVPISLVPSIGAANTPPAPAVDAAPLAPVIVPPPLAADISPLAGGGTDVIPAAAPQQTMRRTLSEILAHVPGEGNNPPPRPAFAVANSALPSVTVMSPLCTGRKKWFPNLYAMFAHQDYPGLNLQLLLLDGRCAKMPDEMERSAFWDEKMKTDKRVRYEYLGPAVKGDEYPASAAAIGAINMTLGAKRNWLALNAAGEIIITFDCDDYYGPSYVSRIVAAFLEHPNADFVKLHAWFSLGERWAYDPLRRQHDWTYIDMKADPLPWGWTYNYRRKLFTDGGSRFGDMDASEEGGFFKSVPADRIYTFADTWFSALRIVTRFVARSTGARRCDYCGPGGNDHPCFQLPEFMVLLGFGGEEKMKPWLEMWNCEH